MKRYSLLLAALVLAVCTLTSCNNGPDGVAEKWLTAFYHRDFQTAKTLSTGETQEQLDALVSLDPSDTAHAVLDSVRKISITVRETRLVNDSTADVTFTASSEPANVQHLKLVKKDSKWLVAWSKLDTNPATGDPLQAPVDGMPRTPDPGTVDYIDTANLEVAPQADPPDTSAGNMMR